MAFELDEDIVRTRIRQAAEHSLAVCKNLNVKIFTLPKIECLNENSISLAFTSCDFSHNDNVTGGLVFQEFSDEVTIAGFNFVSYFTFGPAQLTLEKMTQVPLACGIKFPINSSVKLYNRPAQNF